MPPDRPPLLRPIRLYDGVRQPWLQIAHVRDHLLAWLPTARVELRDDLLAWGFAQCRAHDPNRAAALAERLCQCRVVASQATAPRRKPLPPELHYELRLLEGSLRPTPGVLYDAYELQRLAFSLLPPHERTPDDIHVWLTERLVGTCEDHEARYHARVAVLGYPAILSTSGMVHGPARDRQHYLARRLTAHAEPSSLDEGSDYLQPEDPRLTEVAKGYTMQAILWVLQGDAFCDHDTCRLYNAHWQRDMLRAQLGPRPGCGSYCLKHQTLLRRWSLDVTDEEGSKRQ